MCCIVLLHSGSSCDITIMKTPTKTVPQRNRFFCELWSPTVTYLDALQQVPVFFLISSLPALNTFSGPRCSWVGPRNTNTPSTRHVRHSIHFEFDYGVAASFYMCMIENLINRSYGHTGPYLFGSMSAIVRGSFSNMPRIFILRTSHESDCGTPVYAISGECPPKWIVLAFGQFLSTLLGHIKRQHNL